MCIFKTIPLRCIWTWFLNTKLLCYSKKATKLELPEGWRIRSSRKKWVVHQTARWRTAGFCPRGRWTRTRGWPTPRKSSSKWWGYGRRTCCPARHGGSHSWWWFRRWPVWGRTGWCALGWWPSAFCRSPGGGRCWWAAACPSFSACLWPVIGKSD